jgi:perosamine synthetase
MKNNSMNEFPLLDPKKGIPLFYPYVPPKSINYIKNTLQTRWIGQGPKVELFEKKFKLKFLHNHSALAVGSGTDALHLAYLLSNIKKNDEVLVPVFTCTATNLPLLYIGAKPIFLDIDPLTMNICIDDVKRKITKKTKAIVCVDYAGVPNNYFELNKICKEYNLKLISDAAHSIGTKYFGEYSAIQSDFTIFSFQAIKTLTTGDGGLLAIKNKKLYKKAKRLRWFGIDRASKQKGIWENDIYEIGYKYQMNDIAASLGLAGLETINNVILKRNKLFQIYEKKIKKNNGIRIIGSSQTKEYFNSAWLITIIVEKNRVKLMNILRKNKIESAQVHYRNDRYSIFGGRRKDLPQMDSIEDKYLVLPLHPMVSENDVNKICNIINSNNWKI